MQKYIIFVETKTSSQFVPQDSQNGKWAFYLIRRAKPDVLWKSQNIEGLIYSGKTPERSSFGPERPGHGGNGATVRPPPQGLPYILDMRYRERERQKETICVCWTCQVFKSCSSTRERQNATVTLFASLSKRQDTDVWSSDLTLCVGGHT